MRKRSALGWGELIVGILLMVLGALTFFRPYQILTGLVFIYGILAVVTGIGDIAFYMKVERHTGFGPVLSLVTGILSVLAGLLLLFYPDAGSLAAAFLFPLWFIAHCISRLTHLPIVRLTAGSGRYYVSLVINILGLILGFCMILNPMISVYSMGWIIGFYLILTGLDHLKLAIDDIRSRR